MSADVLSPHPCILLCFTKPAFAQIECHLYSDDDKMISCVCRRDDEALPIYRVSDMDASERRRRDFRFDRSSVSKAACCQILP